MYGICINIVCLHYVFMLKKQLLLAKISLLDFYKSQYRIGLKNPLSITL